jgi:hypothetical protein
MQIGCSDAGAATLWKTLLRASSASSFVDSSKTEGRS